MVPLTTKQNENMTECKIPEHHFAGSVNETKSKADLKSFLHLACWSPCTSTMTTAIISNFLFTWIGLTKQLVQKYLPKSEATAKGHIWKSFKGKQSTQPREPSETPSNNPLVPDKPINATSIFPSNNPSNTPNNYLHNPTPTHIVYLQATNLAGKFYTDQTG